MNRFARTLYCAAFFFALLLTPALQAETGAAAWLRYAALLHSAQEELLRGIRGTLARSLRIEPNLPRNATIVLGAPTAVQKLISGLHPPPHLREDAFWLTNTRDHESSVSSSRQKTTAALCMAYFPC